MFLYDEDVAAWLNALTDKEFVEFFYKHLSARRIVSDDVPGSLAAVSRNRARHKNKKGD